MGEHRSRRVGQAIEFADYLPYQPGMDVRGLDWRVWGRTDKWVVKRFETETELPCAVVLDLSADLATGKAASQQLPDLEGSKAGYAITLAATLLMWLHRHGEPIGLELIAGSFSGAGHRSLPSRSGRQQLQRCFAALAQVRPGGVASLDGALNRVGRKLRRRSWVAVITDGMEEPSDWLPSLQAFAKRGADVRFLHLYDPEEMALSFNEPSVFFSPEGGERLSVDPAGARAVFEEVAAEYVSEVEGGIVKTGARYHRVSSGSALERALREVVR